MNQTKVLLVQPQTRYVPDGPQGQEVLTENIYRIAALIDGAIKRRTDKSPNIVLLPEFCMTGAVSPRKHTDSQAVSRRIPGPETDILGALAQDYKLYIAGATVEYDPDWPDLFFNSSFIIGPSGNVDLKYRKTNEGNYIYGMTDTTPGDIYDPYVEKYGREALWPVLETEYGNLGCVICYDVGFAETARMLALNGAEIILHSTGEGYGQSGIVHRTAWEAQRKTRAFENLCYLASTNGAGTLRAAAKGRFNPDWDPAFFSSRVPGGITARSSSHGGSEAIDYRGEVLARIDGNGEAIVGVTFDLGRLREARRRWIDAFPSAQAITPEQAKIYAQGYDAVQGFPLNKLVGHPLKTAGDGPAHLREVISSLESAPVLANSETRDPTILSFAAEIWCVDRTASDLDVAAAVTASVEFTAKALEAEVQRTGADVVLMPAGWPVTFVGGQGPLSSHGLSIQRGAMAEVATLSKQLNVYLCGAVSERTDDGDLYDTAYIINQHGEFLHQYTAITDSREGYGPTRRSSLRATSGDDATTWSRALPVCHTEFGTFGTVVGREIASVEIVRLLAMQGAEIILNPSAEYDGIFLRSFDRARVTRADENCVYVITANPGTLRGTGPSGSARGGAVIFDFEGLEVARFSEGRVGGVAVRVELDALRRRRRTPMTSRLLEVRPKIYAPTYRRLAEAEGS